MQERWKYFHVINHKNHHHNVRKALGIDKRFDGERTIENRERQNLFSWRKEKKRKQRESNKANELFPLFLSFAASISTTVYASEAVLSYKLRVMIIIPLRCASMPLPLIRSVPNLNLCYQTSGDDKNWYDASFDDFYYIGNLFLNSIKASFTCSNSVWLCHRHVEDGKMCNFAILLLRSTRWFHPEGYGSIKHATKFTSLNWHYKKFAFADWDRKDWQLETPPDSPISCYIFSSNPIMFRS